MILAVNDAYRMLVNFFEAALGKRIDDVSSLDADSIGSLSLPSNFSNFVFALKKNSKTKRSRALEFPDRAGGGSGSNVREQKHVYFPYIRFGPRQPAGSEGDD